MAIQAQQNDAKKAFKLKGEKSQENSQKKLTL